MLMSVTLTMEDVTTLVPTLKAHLNARVMKDSLWMRIISAVVVSVLSKIIVAELAGKLNYLHNNVFAHATVTN